MINNIEQLGKRWWGLLLMLSVPLVAALFPLLFGIKQIFFNTQQVYWYQLFYFYQHAIRYGDSILWNPFIASGFPLFISMTGGFFSPLFYLTLKTLSVPLAYNWLLFLHLLLSAFLTALVAREFRISVFGQLIAGFAYAFGSWVSVFNIVEIQSTFLLPLLSILLLKLSHPLHARRKVLLVTLGILGVMLSWFSVHWPILLLFLLSSVAFSFYLAYQKRREGNEYWGSPPFYLLLMVGVGSLAGLLQLVPTFALVPLSIQFFSGGYSHSEAIRYGLRPEGVFSFFLPYVDHPLLSIRPLYIGILPIIFLIYGFTLNLKKSAGFFSSCLVITLLFAMERSPFFWLLHHVPPIHLIHGPDKWLFVSLFPAALLAGFGLDNFTDQKLARDRRVSPVLHVLRWLLLFISSLSVLSFLITRVFKERLLFLLNTYFDTFVYSASHQFTLNYYHNYIAGLLERALRIFYPFNVKFLLPFFFWAGGYTLLFFYEPMKHAFKKFALFSVIFAAANLSVVFMLMGESRTERRFTEKPQTVTFLQQRLHAGERTFTFLGTTAIFEKLIASHQGADTKELAGEIYNMNTELLLLNTNLRYGIENAEYLDPLAPVNVSSLLAYIGSAAESPYGAGTLLNSPFSIAGKSRLFAARRPIISLLGIRYILSAYPLDERIFPKIFETTATSRNIPVAIYENTSARPLYYFTTEQELADLPATDPATLQRLIETAHKTDTITQDGITLRTRKNALLALTTMTTASSTLLVFSQNNLPGWQAWIDGERIPIHTFATVYQAVSVPAGTHEVRFTYSYWEIWKEFFRMAAN